MPGIFISYRRDDAAGHAGRLYDRLTQRFGKNLVFMDLFIEPGLDFTKTIRSRVKTCDVLLVLIGRQWLTVTDKAGRRRIDDPLDWTRVEVSSALELDIRVIPVLVQGASMPVPESLPDALSGLAARNATELSDTRWEYDAGRLTQIVARVIDEAGVGRAADPSPGSSSTVDLTEPGPVSQSRIVDSRFWKRWVPATVGVVAIAVLLLLAWFQNVSRQRDSPPTEPTPQPGSAASPQRSLPVPDVSPPAVRAHPADVEKGKTRQPARVEKRQPADPAARAPKTVADAQRSPVRVGGNIRPPTKLKDVRPIYPTVAQSARVQGIVIVEATIGTDGRVTRAAVLRSIPLLDAAALEAVRQWEFTPTLVNNVAVPVIMTVTVQFTLR